MCGSCNASMWACAPLMYSVRYLIRSGHHDYIISNIEVKHQFRVNINQHTLTFKVCVAAQTQAQTKNSGKLSPDGTEAKSKDHAVVRIYIAYLSLTSYSAHRYGICLYCLFEVELYPSWLWYL